MPPSEDNAAPATWEEFLDAYAGTIFRLSRLFTGSYDERMDLFLFVCERLQQDGMRRLRTFRYRPEAPCRFSTFLSVVVKNIAVDFIRSREHRFRPFRSVASLDAADQLLFDYCVRDGRTVEESRLLLERRHGIRLTPDEASRRATALEVSLSSSQRWRLLSRLALGRRPLSIDPVAEVALGSVPSSGEPREVPLPRREDDPERLLASREGDRVLQEALEDLGPRERLALALRYRDALPAKAAGQVMGLSAGEVQKLAAQGLHAVRDKLRRARITRADIDKSALPLAWRGTEVRR